MARENSSVEAWGNSRVVARENSSVVARGNSSVEARENSVTRMVSSKARVTAGHASLVLCECEETGRVDIKDKAQLVTTKPWEHTIGSFMDIYQANIQADGRILLYKSVQKDLTDFWTGEIKYEGIVKCPDWDPNPNRECGGGLHLSPTRELALQHNKGVVLRCLVAPNDIVIHPTNITKVRCREVEVVGLDE